MTFDRDELEAAFRTYWQLGAVGEDWDAWCDTCFTEDVTYVEHVLGNKQGRDDRRRGRHRNYSDFSAYRDATTDYSSRLGDREMYRRYYREGFENGYEDGYRGY